MGKQKRSENTYQKINTIFMRDANNVIMPYERFTEPEFEYLRHNKWEASEKIDGTNMRIEVTKEEVLDYTMDPSVLKGVKFNIRIAGKTDNAQIPKNLLKHLTSKFQEQADKASTEERKKRALGRVELAKALLSSKDFEFDSKEDIEKTQDSGNGLALNYRTLTNLLIGSDGTKEDFLAKWNEYTNSQKKKMTMCQRILRLKRKRQIKMRNSLLQSAKRKMIVN